MKPFIMLASAAAFSIVGAIATANAMPLAPLADSSTPGVVHQAAWGCGPGWHPDPWGRCVPNWRGGGGYGWRGRPAYYYGGYGGGWRHPHHHWRGHHYGHRRHW